MSLALFAQARPQSALNTPAVSFSGDELEAAPQQGRPAQPEPGAILGTVSDVNDAPVAGAAVELQGPESTNLRTATTDASGFFEIEDVPAGIPLRLAIVAQGFARWQSSDFTLTPGQHKIVDAEKLRVEEMNTTITVTPETSEEIAIQEVKVEEKQRGFGVIPNFFEAYGHQTAPLTAKLKFDLALRASRDPFTAVGIAVVAGARQGAGSPNYVLGAKGYGERFGATYADQVTSVMIGGAILPSILHQDPRYFYQGTGSKWSRGFHALSSLVVAKGDNGHWQPNYSSVGGDLASAGISNLYYPKSNRGANLVLTNFAVNSAVHAVVRLLQEFAFRPTKGTTVRDAAQPGALSN